MTEQTLDQWHDILPPRRRNTWPETFARPVVIDCEWNKDTGELTLVGVGNEDGVVQVWWQELDEPARIAFKDWLCQLVQRVLVIYHNADADIRKLRENHFASLAGEMFSVELHKQLEDTMLAHAVLHCEEDHTLEWLTEEYGKLPRHKHLADVDLGIYNTGDLLETLWSWRALEGELALDPAAEMIYRKQSLAKLPYIVHQEERGIATNKKLLYPLRDKFEARRMAGARLAQAATGRLDFNVGSPAQLKHWVYGVEKFPVQYAKAAPGQQGPPTLDKDALAKLRQMVGTEWDADDAPTLEQAWENVEAGGSAILEARYLFFGAQQALSHYIDPCFEWDGDNIAGIRDRIYPETRQHVQTSGRESVVGPAMQQLKGELELIVTPDPGTVWLGWDWSNIETWLLGALAGDPLILEAKRQGWDTHTLNYCDITDTTYPTERTKKLHECECPECIAWRAQMKWQGEDDIRRTFAKRYVYRVHYRGKPEHAGDIPGAKALGFNEKKLVRASEAYLSKHHWIPEWWKKIECEVDRYGVVYTFMGRPRRLTSPYRNARYREACNHPMQGGVADIYNTTRLMIHELCPWLEFVYGKHDAQWWQCPEDRVEEAWSIIKPLVEREFVINDMPISFAASFKERRTE